jgi:hypothetical protein
MYYIATFTSQNLLCKKYSIQKPKNVGAGYEENVVAELDSALNQWIDSIPDHRKFFPAN